MAINQGNQMENVGYSPQIDSGTQARPFAWLSAAWDDFFRDPGGYLLAGIMSVALVVFTAFLIWGPVMLGLAAMGLRQSKLARTETADFFQGFRYFLPSVLAGLLVLAFSLVGSLFLIVPGIVILSMYLFTFHFIFDQGQDFWQAMESSRKLVAQDYFGFGVFTVILLTANGVCAFTFFVGNILTLPLSSLAITAAYLECTRPPAAPSAKEQPVVIE